MNGPVTVTTGARLHFGLLDVQPPFGGVGAMIEAPATQVVVSASSKFECARYRDRIEPIARRLSDQIGIDGLPPISVHVAQRPPSHHGLGSGTQLALAAAQAMIHCLDAKIEPTLIAGRGNRSCIGIHGFRGGGFINERSLVTSGTRQPRNALPTSENINPALHQLPLPESWGVLLVAPLQESPIISGEDENRQFAALPPATEQQQSEMIRWIDEAMIQAIEDQDMQTFGESVFQYNRISGELFAQVQGGHYQSKAVAELISQIRDRGIRGVGQSSWGPGVFVIDHDEKLDQLAIDLAPNAKPIARTRFRNRGFDLS